jgi:hypothetical protein
MYLQCVDASSFREHAKRALLIIILERACQHTTSVGIMLLTVLESATAALLLRCLAKAWMVEG